MKYYFFFLCIICSTASFSQQNAIYYFNQGWEPVKEKSAVYMVRHKKLPDNTWQMDYYHYNGPLIRSESYTDNKAATRQGRWSWYNRHGYIDSSGFFNNNLRDKSWYYYYPDSDSGKISKIVDYDKGTVLKIDDKSQMKEETKDTVATDEKESEFVGGTQGWMRFLNKTFRYPVRAVELGSQGTIRILFVITTEGKVEDPLIYKSAEMSLDDESLRVLNATPAWVPAMKDGQKVKTYKIQPFTFRLHTGR